MENLYKIKLRSQVNQAVLTFDVAPDLSETRSVEYKGMNPLHMPGTIYSYSHTASRLFGINNARFISRTPEEAAFNLARLNLLRSWTLPYFGRADGDLLGSPPDVLSLFAYAIGPSGNSLSDNAKPDVYSQNTVQKSSQYAERRERATHLHNIPTVIYNLTVTYPSDIDYIPTGAAQFRFGTGPREQIIDIQAGIPMPTILATDVQLYETHSPSEFNSFDLRKYRQGLLDTF